MKFLAKPLSLILSLIFVFYCDSFLSMLHAGVDAPQTRESRVLGSAFSDPSISGNASQRPIGALLRTRTPFKWDFDGDGAHDLLIGAEDGHLYCVRNPRTN